MGLATPTPTFRQHSLKPSRDCPAHVSRSQSREVRRDLPESSGFRALELGWGGALSLILGPEDSSRRQPSFLTTLCPVLSSACDGPLCCPHMVNPRAPGRQLPVWCKNHLSFVDFVRLTKSLACFTAIVMVLRRYPPLIRGCTWQVSGS